ncbi:hypothetical protein K458DRAFT_48249 [Lentithecium fluviatile CBS 122367]|uniref:Fork-head domain-containing protein n=1 Tax=Lentithecium fluviatile CBS 122367 TaxID=1168545 RepID=A0A6G1IYB2_9PLEO|nr:hypothetical protein K458DRAFT_48249 [Lentithecium fluviatile CBS 122367]
MLVAPGEHLFALTPGDAAAQHATTTEPNTIAPPPDEHAAMDVATADAPSAPVGMAATAPDLNAAVSNDAGAMLDPASTAFAMPPVMATTMPSLDAPISLPADMHMEPMAPDYVMNGDMSMNGYSNIGTAEQQLSAFARLRFDDGSYYMHTYQIILGRNVHLAHKDMRRLAKVEQLQAKGEQQRAQALLHGRRKRHAGARSVISEAGGIVNAPVEMMPMEYQQRRQSIASHSLASSGSLPKEGPEPDHAPQEMIMQAFPEAPDTFDSHVPEDPNDCPIVPIHPQHIVDRTGLRGPKGISRQHAKIFYDFDHGHFCLAVLGSNGLHHEDNFLPKGTCVELNHGDTITIGMVEMTFFLPDIALTEEQRNRQESGSQSRPMSFSFENGQGESEDMDDSGSEDLSVNPRHVYHYPVGSDLESEDDGIPEDDDMDDLEDDYSPAPRPKPSLKLKLKNKHQVPPPKASKHGHKDGHRHGLKRKAVREPSPEEPPPKKAKQKAKESQKELPKEKSKAYKIPAKAPAKQPTKAPAKMPKGETPKAISPPKEQLAEPTPHGMLGSPVSVRVPDSTSADRIDLGEGTISAEVVAKYGLPESLIGQQLPTRKGPGRPPKDGLMSKRQRSQLIKQGKEIEKARAQGLDITELPPPIVKPKIARRKESNAGEEDDIRESTEKGDGLGTPSDKKQPKPAKPARTPSPEMRVEDYTEEQLQRPTSNYVVLIHEAISSATTGQMNLQQIYNYIEKNYPWYKFKTTTSGWQSSVRHNLGQHDAFVKGDKEGKGYMWRINPSVSIEKERRKRQVSPPQVNNAQRQGYYPPPNGYPPYGQPGYYQGMPPHGLPPNGVPRPLPSVEAVQPRLPPSMARASSSSAPAAPQTAPAPSPYASPWAGGNTAGSPPTQMSPRPYPPPTSQTPPVSSTAPPSGQYGVLYPTTAPPATSAMYTGAGGYGSPYVTSGPTPSPYASTPGRAYTPYPPPGPSPHSYSGAPSTSGYAAHAHHTQAHGQPSQYDAPSIPHPSGRYPLSTNPDLIRQLEAFRTVYLQTRIEPGEDAKVDNAIKAYVTPELASTLTPQEQNLLVSIKTIPTLEGLRITHQPIKQEDDAKPNGTPAPAPANVQTAPTTTATAAAIAADAAANTVPNNPASTAQTAPSNEPQKFMPNMAGPPSSAPAPPIPVATPAHVQTQRPSVEPLTPVPGSPAVQNGTPVKRSITDITASAPEGTASGAQDAAKSTDAPPAKMSKTEASPPRQRGLE